MGRFAVTRRGASALLLALWQITTTATHTFVWDGLRAGAIDLRPLGRTLRLLAAAGLLLIVLFLLGIVFNGALRVSGPLETIGSSTPTRGLVVPALAVPITLAAVALGWGYLLAGALHARPVIRWGTLVAYLCFGALPLARQFASFGVSAEGWAALALLALLVVCFVALPRTRWPLAVEWSIVLLAQGGVLLLGLTGAARGQLLRNEPVVNDFVDSLVLQLLFFIAPFLFIAGRGWVDFALDASGWAARAVQRHASAAIVSLLLFVLLGYRLYGLVAALTNDGIRSEQWGAWGGAALLLGGVAAVAWWRARQPAGGSVPLRLLTIFAALIPALQILLVVGANLALAWLLLQPFRPDLVADANTITGTQLALSNAEPTVRPLLIALAAAVVAAVAAQRANATLAAFGMSLAWNQLLAWLTRAGRPLEALGFAFADVDALLLVGMALVGLLWAARRQLTPERALRLLALALLFALLNQTDFLDNPFSPLFGFAGVFFLVFGIVWNVLNAGGQFVNHDTPGLPRASRLLLYTGYVLITLSVTHWFLVSHNIAMQRNQGIWNVSGFTLLGLPLAYLALVEGGARLIRAGDAP